MASLSRGPELPPFADHHREGATFHRARAALLTLALLIGATPAAPVAAVVAPAPAPLISAAAATPVPFTTTSTDLVAPGVTYRHGTWTTADGAQAVELFDVDPTTPGISLEASSAAGGVAALQAVSGQAARVSRDGHRVVAAVNGDIWSVDAASGRSSPVGLAIHAGELLTATTTPRPTVGLDPAEAPRLGDVAVSGTVELPGGNTTLGIDRVNKPRPTGALVLYTRRWGSSTGTVAGGTEVVLTGAALPLRASGSWTATVASVVASGSNASIPAGAIVLSAQGADATALATLAIGSTVTISTAITPGWEDVAEAISGQQWLVHGGDVHVAPVSAITTAAHPRTALGVRADGSLVLAAVDGRQPSYSVGVTADDLGDLLVAQGATEAINLDGGGSTTALARLPGDVSASVVNHPSDGAERAVDEALLVVSSIPTGPLSQVVVRPGDRTLVVGQVLPFVARGVDAARNGVPVAARSVKWSVTGLGGTLGSDLKFRARRPGTAVVRAAVGGHAGTATITVVPDTIAPVGKAPATRLQTGGTVTSSTVPVAVSWPAATDVGSGVGGYELAQRLGAGSWTAVRLPSPTARSVVVRLAPGVAVQFRLRAYDRAGNRSAWKNSTMFLVRTATERGATYTGSWATRSGGLYLNGAGRAARAAGATATYRFTGSQVAWLAPRASTSGSATVLIDGRRVATVSLRSSVTQPRRVVFSYTWSAIGRHTITIRVAGTAGHPWVNVDGFAVVDVASPYPVLAGAGDIASCSLTADSATATLLDRTPGTVFAAGDLAYESGTAAQFRNCYGPTWGGFKARTRPVPGNHEYLSAAAAPYFAWWGSRAGTAGQGWYAYDLGTWRIYNLNSNCASVGGCGPGSVQDLWLKADLAAHPTQCVAAIWHHPLFSSGVHGNDADMLAAWQDLYAAGAELVVNGHDHDYERFAPQSPDGTPDPAAGIREFVVGTGGAALRSFAAVQPNSEVRKTGVHGILKLTLMPGKYTWQFVPVAGSTWTDSGTESCH